MHYQNKSMEGDMQSNNNLLHHHPSIELPQAKKSKYLTKKLGGANRPRRTGIKGNNRYGRKGTYRCEKCQSRKGKCNFNDPMMPCDYCSARGLDCGLKLPTPRKRQQMSGRGILSGATLPLAIAQPLTSRPLSGQLQIQIPVTVSGGTINLSSATTEYDMSPYLTSPINPPGYEPYSNAAGIASLMMGFAQHVHVPPVRPSPTSPIVQTWQSQETSTAQCPYPPYVTIINPDTTPEVPDPRPAARKRESFSAPPCIPPRHPAHTLNRSVLGIVNSAIPSFPPGPIDVYDPSQEDLLWEEFQELFLELEASSSTRRFNRLFQIPKHMRGKKLAGKWDESIVKHEGETKTVTSIQTCPSII